MRWLVLTMAMLTASVLLVAGIYVRDRGSTGFRPPPQPLAQRDAQEMLSLLDGGRCADGCTVALVRHPGPSRWVARFQVAAVTKCFELDLLSFRWTQSGLEGVHVVGCPGAPET